MRSDEWPALVFLLVFGFLGAGGRLPKARRGRFLIVQFIFFFVRGHSPGHETVLFMGEAAESRLT